MLEAIQSAPDPAPISSEHVTWHGEGDAARPVVHGIEQALLSALETGAPFSRDGVAWACEDAITTWHPSAPAPQEPSTPAHPADAAPAPTTTTGSRADGRDAPDEENRS